MNDQLGGPMERDAYEALDYSNWRGSIIIYVLVARKTCSTPIIASSKEMRLHFSMLVWEPSCNQCIRLTPKQSPQLL